MGAVSTDDALDEEEEHEPGKHRQSAHCLLHPMPMPMPVVMASMVMASVVVAGLVVVVVTAVVVTAVVAMAVTTVRVSARPFLAVPVPAQSVRQDVQEDVAEHAATRKA